MDQTKSIELQKKRLESAEEMARGRASSACAQTQLIIMYDKGGTVEVYGECFKLIGLFCLLLLHVSIIFLNLQPPSVNTKIQGVGSLAM